MSGRRPIHIDRARSRSPGARGTVALYQQGPQPLPGTLSAEEASFALRSFTAQDAQSTAENRRLSAELGALRLDNERKESRISNLLSDNAAWTIRALEAESKIEAWRKYHAQSSKILEK